MEGDFKIDKWLIQPQLNVVVSPDNTTVQLEPKVMEVLVFLAEHAGEVVSKEILLQALWGDAFVTENALTRCIAELRRIFRDDAVEPRLIQTITQKGYRLIAPVSKLKAAASRYEILEKLGEGGMGEVFLARDTELQRKVALKFIRAGDVEDDSARRRLLREARAAAALDHPFIGKIFDTGAMEGRTFIAMEYLEGRTLKQKLAKGQLDTKEALRLAAEIAEALEAAHDKGVVHRDLKPSNIMITPQGHVKVMDFGLAKRLPHADTSASSEATASALTREGTTAGTLPYMSPEQLRAEAVDHRSDIFSFGIVLYEMLTGMHPFQRGNPIDTGGAILHDAPPPLGEHVPGAHSLLGHVIGKLLAKTAERRYQSIHDARTDLAEVIEAPTAPQAASTQAAMPQTPPRRRKWWIALAAAGLVVAGAAVMALASLLISLGPVEQGSSKYTPFSSDPEREIRGVWSPDGGSVAYIKEVPGKNSREWCLFVRGLENPTAVELTRGMMEYQPPFWSSDSRRIYFFREAALFSVSSVGGEPEQLMDGLLGYCSASLSPDGRILALWKWTVKQDDTAFYSVWISSPPGAEPRRYEPHFMEIKNADPRAELKFSPDGTKIGLSIVNYSTRKRELWLLPWPDRGPAIPRRIFPVFLPQVITFDWMPDSRHIVLAGERLRLGDTETGKLQDLNSPTTAELEPSVSRDGLRIMHTRETRDYEIVRVPLDGAPIRPVITSGRQEYSASWSRSGDRMAFVTDRFGQPEIWLRSSQGDFERRVVTQRDFPGDTTISILSAAISADGRSVAFLREGENSPRSLWLAPAEGGRPILAFPGAERASSTPAWSPDGTMLTFSVIPEGPWRLALARPGSSEPFRVLNDSFYPQTVSAWSPDGRWIAVGGQNAQELLVTPPDGKSSRRFRSPVHLYIYEATLVWSGDSRTVYVASSGNGNTRLDALDIASGNWRQIADWGTGVRLRAPFANNHTAFLSPDGTSIVTTAIEWKSDLWILEGFPRPAGERYAWLGPLARLIGREK